MLEIIFGDVGTALVLAIISAVIIIPIQLYLAKTKAKLAPVLVCGILTAVFLVLTLVLRGMITFTFLGLAIYFAWLTLVLGATLLIKKLAEKKRK